MKHKAKSAEGPWVKHRLAMYRSDAWRLLDHNAKKFIERLEIELMLHGGKDNGQLPCTFNDFEEYGIRRQVISRCQRRACAYGFVQIMRKGRRSAFGGSPTLYRLTYLPDCAGSPATDEWQHYRPNSKPTWTGGKRRKNGCAKRKCSPESSDENGTVSSAENGTRKVRISGKSHGVENGTTSTCYPSIGAAGLGDGGGDDLSIPAFLRRDNQQQENENGRSKI